MRSSTTTSGSIGLPGILFVVFVVLKLTGVIEWSWWWVAAPLWAPLAAFGIVAGIVFAVAGIVALFKR